MPRVFYICSSVFLTIAAFVLWSPSLLIPDLIYPQRIDSVYVQFQKDQFIKSHPETDLQEVDSLFNFNPGDLGLQYSSFDVKTIDSLILKGWFIPVNDTDAASLLVLHDWNESKIQKINFAKQMHDRGFNVYLMDMRAHGNSEGQIFSPGIISASDVKNITDSILLKHATNHLAMMGSGIAAGIVIQAALFDGRADVLIVQCPYDNFEKVLKSYSHKTWGFMDRIFYPVLKRKIEKIIQQPVEEFNMSDYVKGINTPILFITAGEDPVYSSFYAYPLYSSVASEKKELFLVGKATHETIEQEGGDEYYNKIGAFISTSIPKKQARVRNKKMT